MDPCGFDTLGIPLELRIKLLDRQIVYPGALPRDVDILNPEKNTMLSFGALLRSVLGTTSVVDGLIGTQTTVPSLSINIGQGSITSLQNVDNTAFGSLAADTTDTIVKQGFNLTTTVLALAAPTTVGWSQNYLIEATFAESDTGSTVLPYVDAALPSSPFNGPANAGTSQNTQRIQRVNLQALAGVAAATGTQTTPAVTAGWVPLYVVTVAYGQTTITTSQITLASGAPFVDPLQAGRGIQPGRLLNVQIFNTAGTSTYTPTPGTNTIEVEVQGGGGAGGGCPATGSSQISLGGGGGAGAWAWLRITSPTSQTVTVGAGGTGVSGAAGGNGGASSFGALLAANGGSGGPVAGPSSATSVTVGSGAGGTVGSTGSRKCAGLAGFQLLSASTSAAAGGVVLGTMQGQGAGGGNGAIPQSTAAQVGPSGQTGGVVIREYA
jgi:hypothetical protein